MLASEYPAPYQRAVVRVMSAAQDFLDGEFVRAEAAVIEALGAGLPGVTPPALSQLYYHRLETGRIGELEARVRALIAVAPGILGWRCALARLLVELGRCDEAAREVAALGDPARVPRDRTWLVGVAVLAEAVAELGDAERAHSLCELLRPHARVNVAGGSTSLFYGNVAHFVGLLEAAQGRLDAAGDFLAAAQRVHVRMRAVPWMLRSRLESSRLLRLRGDDARAEELAAAVRVEAEALGMWSVAKRAARS